MRSLIARWGAWLLLVTIVSICLAGAWALSLATPLPAGDEFNVLRWELEHVPNKWLYLTDRFFTGRLSSREEDERLGRYLLLTARIQQTERALADEAAPSDDPRRDEVARLRSERDSLENDVEAAIEGRLTAVLEDEGLESSFPLFPDFRWAFPPVDFELDQPLLTLVLSHRDRVELIDQRPLQQGLSLEQVVDIEGAEEADGARSALVLGVAGAATYPSIVAPRAGYQDLAETVAHEWVHHYLAFQPLGQRYFASLELKTLNETVANIAGKELGALLVGRYPLPGDVAAELALLNPEPSVDPSPVLRQLRLDVEALLGEGLVDEAEGLMERRRLELEDGGVRFRRINQAFFAFRDVYADDPSSIDPIGLKLLTLRQREGSAEGFLREAARLTSGGELDELLSGGD
ncbi:MAG: hypothetical protein WEE64_12690 [Dehalococcoidia bacterium]